MMSCCRYFENNSSGNGQDFYSHGYDGSIDVSSSVFANIDCETNTVNDYVLNSLDNYADFIQSDISGACIEDVDFYVSVNGDNDNNGTEFSPFATIGHALSFVKGIGDATTIFVGAGTYSPDLTGEVFPILIPNNVHLIGENTETTILDASADSTNEAAVVIIKEVETVTLKNFTLMNGYSESHGCSGGGGLLIAADDMYNMYADDGGTGVDVNSTPLIENLIIEDEGPGFNEKNIDKVFNRFYSNRPEKFGEHSGLGLNIVKNIIELHGGSIIASNQAGDKNGAKIEVLLPIINN